jgi:hypothetical protein
MKKKTETNDPNFLGCWLTGGLGLDLDCRVYCPRCGELAPLEISINAHVPYDHPSRSNRQAVSFNIAACRKCVIEAAELVIKFLKGKKENEA